MITNCEGCNREIFVPESGARIHIKYFCMNCEDEMKSKLAAEKTPREWKIGFSYEGCETAVWDGPELTKEEGLVKVREVIE